ncbi:MAG: Stp1/IreP family PP2C-type Ser/Thr phosphatase [Elusimicrobiales bacterium]|nr:Stp1/IreP family PP2C-type Ser/Thr phosphatase [Elusimicrobiales bacterium]MCK5584036.1 Stp1/IreP family PP2C-type Ser/Thr phosphatase [Elusimicrobiales bacterium]
MNFKIKFECLSDVGKSRKNNEDNVLVSDELDLAIVADGMGGHNSGEVASKIAVTVTKEKYESMTLTQSKPSEYDEKHSMKANQLAFAIKLANSVIYEAGNTAKDNKGMGTTASALLLNKDKYSIAHIGDSRIYLLRKNVLQQLTEDHSLVMEHVKKGLLTREQADKSPLQNILTRALGTQKNPAVDIYELPVEEHDRVILCSDGLFKAMSEEDMVKILNEESDDKKACEKLVETANINGGPDNVTVIIGTIQKKNWKESIKDMLK